MMLRERAIETGKKDDAGKSAIDLIDPSFVKGVGDVLEFGRNKYGQRNWEQGMSWGRLFAALNRHIWAFWGGEKLDPETGLHHLHHAAFCLMALAAFDRSSMGTDDRSRLDNPQETQREEKHE